MILVIKITLNCNNTSINTPTNILNNSLHGTKSINRLKYLFNSGVTNLKFNMLWIKFIFLYSRRYAQFVNFSIFLHLVWHKHAKQMCMFGCIKTSQKFNWKIYSFLNDYFTIYIIIKYYSKIILILDKIQVKLTVVY